MGTALIRMKIMPESPSSDLNAIKSECTAKFTAAGAKVHSVEEEPIAFGLIALIFTLIWPEEKDQSIVEEAIKGVQHIQSAEIIDFRRAFG
ncbi:MAG: elongation factor 1-beta [archaeon]